MTSMNDDARAGGDQAYLRTLGEFLRRNRLLVLGVPIVAVLVTAAFVQVITPVYEAEALIRVEEERATVPLAEALRTFTAGGGSKIHTEMAVLRTRVVAEDVVDDLNLHVDVRAPRRVPRAALFDRLSAERTAQEGEYRLEREGRGFRVPGAAGGSEAAGVVVRPGEPVRLPGVELVLAEGALDHDVIALRVRPFARAVIDFRRTVRVHQPSRDADVIAVAYQGRDRVLVRDVPAIMAARFIERRQAGKSAEARAMVSFLGERIAHVTAELDSMEREVVEFREANRMISVEEEAKAEVERLAMLQAARDAADAERVAIAQSMDQAAAEEGSTARRLMYFPTLLRSSAASEIMGMLTELENRRSALLELRTPEDPEVRVLTERIEELERELARNAVAYLDGLSNQVESYDRTLNRFRAELDRIPARQIRLARMEREASVLEEAYLLIEARRQQAELEAATADWTVQVVDPPVLPVDPVRPRKLLSVLLAGILGLVAGFGAALTREQLDTRVRTREDLRTASGAVPVLGTIPRMSEALASGRQPGGRGLGVGLSRGLGRVVGRRNGGRLELTHRLVTGTDPANPVSEAYRTLRTNITFARLDQRPRTLVFTSAMPGDGKSTSASNLAITLAQQGLDSVLVDADLRRGRLHRILSVPLEPGLADILLGHTAIEEAVRLIELDRGATLRFIPGGTLPPNPADLLASERMREVIAELVDRYDTVLLDAPPLSLAADAAILGTRVDGVVLVARAGITDRAALGAAIQRLEEVGAPILGTVLNDVATPKGHYYAEAQSGGGGEA
jgi:capsular exopolysaccharide synthesis family protein